MPESSLGATASSQPTSLLSTGKVGSINTRRKHSARVQPAQDSDIASILAEGLRAQDIAECLALGRDPNVAVPDAVHGSRPMAFAIYVDESPCALFGVMATEIEDLGAAWMLGTDRILLARETIIHEAPLWLDFMQSIYPTVTNFIDERNTVSYDWLVRLGFEFPFTDDFVTDEGVTFRRFTRCVNPSVSA